MILEYNIFNKWKSRIIDDMGQKAYLKIRKHLKRVINSDVIDDDFYKTTKKLLDNKHIPGYLYNYLLEVAVDSNDLKLVKMVLDHPSVKGVTSSAITLAAKKSNFDILKLFLDTDKDVNWLDAFDNYVDNSIIMNLRYNDRIDILEKLIKYPIIQNSIYESRLYDVFEKLVQLDEIDYIKLLLPYYKDIALGGNRILTFAIINDRTEISKLLLSDETVLKGNLYEPFVLSIINNNNEIFDILIELVKDYLPDDTFGIADAIYNNNYYALEKILKSVNWNRYVRENSLSFWLINDCILQNITSDKLSITKKQKIIGILIKFPNFVKELDDNISKKIMPIYKPRKVSKLSDDDWNE